MPTGPIPPAPTAPATVPIQTKKNLLPLFLVVGALALAAGTFFLGNWLAKKTPCPTATCPTPNATTKVSTFSSKQFNFAFEYPTEWGEALEEAKPIGDAQNYHGHQYYLTFAHNPYLTIIGSSKDSSSPGVGGACPIRVFFKGTAETGLLACNQCNSEVEGCGGCQTTNIGGQSAVSFLYKPTTSCGALGFQKIIYLKTPYNTNNQDFPGLVLTLSLATIENGQLADLGYRSGSSSVGGSEEEQQQQRDYLKGIFEEKAQELNTSLLSSASSDYLSQIQLSQLEQLVKSIRFSK